MASAIPSEKFVEVYEALQPAYAHSRNVIAHAGASRAAVRLLRNGDIAEIIIEDDGRGFDVPSSLEHGKGLGLVSITERARFVGGTVTVVANPNQGTRVWAQVPAHAVVTGGNSNEHA